MDRETMAEQYFWRNGEGWIPAPPDEERCSAVTDVVAVPLEVALDGAQPNDPDVYRCRRRRGHEGAHAAPGITWRTLKGATPG